MSIQAKGISPDIEVALARIEKLEGGPVREENLRGALDKSGEDAEDGSQNARDVDPAEIDFQLARALDLLKGLTVFGKLNS